MRKIYLLIFLALCGKVNSITSRDCNMHWGPWELTPLSASGGVFYAVQYSTCTKSGGLCGWPKIKLKHTFPEHASVSITLKGIDCDGKSIESSFSTGGDAIAANADYLSQGNWHTFKRVDEATKVEVNYKSGNDRWRLVYDKEKGGTTIYKNFKKQ